MLAILLFSYRQTIKAYPSAGGAYIVTKDNFGLLTAQLAGVALLTDYVLTVSVSVAAGVAAITSAAPRLYPYRVWLSVAFIWFIAWGNLRGVRESGRMFAVPTYFFIVMMFLLLGIGLAKSLAGDLQPLPFPTDVAETTGAISLFLDPPRIRVRGRGRDRRRGDLERRPRVQAPRVAQRPDDADVDGEPARRHVPRALLPRGASSQVVPTETKTVISEVGRAVFGGGALGTALFLMLQVATTLILILAANTAFADFPRLANFHAKDDFMPRPLTKRGHRLVFSNGIIGLAIASTALVVLFQADVHRLIPLYAIGVFTSFTLSQAGMAKRHLRLREPGWRHGLLINGLGRDHDRRRDGRDRDHEVRRRCVGRDGVRPGDGVDPRASEPPVRARARRARRRSSPRSSAATVHPADHAGTGRGRRPQDDPRAPVREDDPVGLHEGGPRRARRGGRRQLQRRWAELVNDVPLEVIPRGPDDPTATIARHADGTGPGDATSR